MVPRSSELRAEAERLGVGTTPISWGWGVAGSPCCRDLRKGSTGTAASSWPGRERLVVEAGVRYRPVKIFPG